MWKIYKNLEIIYTLPPGRREKKNPAFFLILSSCFQDVGTSFQFQ